MIDINIQYLPSRIICISKIQVLLLKARRLVIRDPSFKDGHGGVTIVPLYILLRAHIWKMLSFSIWGKIINFWTENENEKIDVIFEKL